MSGKTGGRETWRGGRGQIGYLDAGGCVMDMGRVVGVAVVLCGYGDSGEAGVKWKTGAG